MNVRELIEALQKFDPELMVVKIDTQSTCGHCYYGDPSYDGVESPTVRDHVNIDGGICIEGKFPKFIKALII